jgi:ubiquinone/menaquinone biosynthesis C-methylase UbiE
MASNLNRLLPFFFLLLTGLFSCTTEPAEQQTDPAAQEEEIPSTGFYDDYEGTNRVIWQKPEMVINLLGDLDNKTVADIGAGSGHFSKRLVEKAKKVIAIDIDQRFIHFLDSIRIHEIPEEFRDRLEPRLAEPNDPHLQPEEVDAVLIVNTFMYMEDRQAYLENLSEALTSGGKILIIDFKKKATPIGPPVPVRLDGDTVINDLKETGFKNITIDNDKLQYQYIVMAEK